MFVFFSLISFFFFFFSSRRRHTRYIGDWSSDVCSSDLTMFYDRMRAQAGSPELKNYIDTHKAQYLALLAQDRVRPSPAPPAVTAAGKRKEPSGIASPKPKLRAPEPPLPQ